MNNPKFELYADKSEQYRFRLKARNGQVILASEGYRSKAACQNGIASVQKNAPHDARYRRETSSNGKYYFTLTAANNEIIGRSEMYARAQSRDKGIEAVKRVAADAPVEDLS